VTAPDAPTAVARPRWRHALAVVPLATAALYNSAVPSVTTWDAAIKDYVSVVVLHPPLRVALLVVTFAAPLPLLALAVKKHRLAPATWLIALAATASLWSGLCTGSLGRDWWVDSEVVGRDGSTYAILRCIPFLGPRTARLVRRVDSGVLTTRYEVIHLLYIGKFSEQWPPGSTLSVEPDGTIVVRAQEEYRYLPPPK